MRLILVIAAAASIAFSTNSQAQKIDANGRCHAADGKMAKMEVCKGLVAEQTKCRDIKTKRFAKCGTPGTEAVPSKTDKPSNK
jgi:hypothetical protein